MLSTLPPDAKMVAANAVYFNANWEEPFEKEITSLQPFTVSATETVQVSRFCPPTLDNSRERDKRLPNPDCYTLI